MIDNYILNERRDEERKPSIFDSIPKTIYKIEYILLLNPSCEAIISSKNESGAVAFLRTDLMLKLNNYDEAWKKKYLGDFGFEILNISSTEYHSLEEGIISLGFDFPKL